MSLPYVFMLFDSEKDTITLKHSHKSCISVSALQSPFFPFRSLLFLNYKAPDSAAFCWKNPVSPTLLYFYLKQCFHTLSICTVFFLVFFCKLALLQFQIEISWNATCKHGQLFWLHYLWSKSSKSITTSYSDDMLPPILLELPSNSAHILLVAPLSEGSEYFFHLCCLDKIVNLTTSTWASGNLWWTFCLTFFLVFYRLHYLFIYFNYVFIFI